MIERKGVAGRYLLVCVVRLGTLDRLMSPSASCFAVSANHSCVVVEACSSTITSFITTSVPQPTCLSFVESFCALPGTGHPPAAIRKGVLLRFERLLFGCDKP